ncbi:MAG: GAF domain-containing protein [Hyphomicrobiaceae bacterium]
MGVAREQLTATSEVLQTITRFPSQTQPVLDAIVTAAARLCRASHATIFRLEDGRYHPAATSHSHPELVAYQRLHPVEPSRGTLVGRTAIERRIVHLPDALADPEYTSFETQKLGRFRTMLGVPLLHGGEPFGVIALVRSTVDPFSEKQIELIRTFADQAVIAIENARLFEEVQARTGKLARSVEELPRGNARHRRELVCDEERRGEGAGRRLRPLRDQAL